MTNLPFDNGTFSTHANTPEELSQAILSDLKPAEVSDLIALLIGDMEDPPAFTNVEEILLAFQRSKVRIARERDLLRDIVSEAEDILESVDGAHNEMERAADTLSQYL